MQDEWKEKIRASAIINRLIGCVNGEIELNAQQIKAADIILKKVVPDLARTESQLLDEKGLPTTPSYVFNMVVPNSKLDD